MPRAILPLLAAAASLLVAGCDLPGTPVPQAARLSPEVLTVTLTDGTDCTAMWKGAPAGPLTGCPDLTYQVAVVENPNLLRKLVEGITDALKADGALAPMAEVKVFSGDRSWRFVSPPPVE